MDTISTQLAAFLKMITVSEIGEELMAKSDDGFNVIVGSTPDNPDLFSSYADHPRKHVQLANGTTSTAAGAFQILGHYFDSYQNQLGLPDFSPRSQERIAVRMIMECSALAAIESGNIEQAVHLCRSRWASLPGAGYGQHENSLEHLLQAFRDAGGHIAGEQEQEPVQNEPEPQVPDSVATSAAVLEAAAPVSTLVPDQTPDATGEADKNSGGTPEQAPQEAQPEQAPDSAAGATVPDDLAKQLEGGLTGVPAIQALLDASAQDTTPAGDAATGA